MLDLNEYKIVLTELCKQFLSHNAWKGFIKKRTSLNETFSSLYFIFCLRLVNANSWHRPIAYRDKNAIITQKILFHFCFHPMFVFNFFFMNSFVLSFLGVIYWFICHLFIHFFIYLFIFQCINLFVCSFIYLLVLIYPSICLFHSFFHPFNFS